MNQKLRALFGLKWNPFSPDVPAEALWRSPAIEHFCWRIEELVREGGFALITGDPGTGKSVALRILAHHLEPQPDVLATVLTRPQSSLGDFYRELGLNGRILEAEELNAAVSASKGGSVIDEF